MILKKENNKIKTTWTQTNDGEQQKTMALEVLCRKQQPQTKMIDCDKLWWPD